MERRSRSPSVFLPSGGTTGLPKLIPRTHDDYISNARASAELCGLDAETVYLAFLPVSHNFPLACPGILGTWEAGGRVVLLNYTRLDDPPEVVIETQGRPLSPGDEIRIVDAVGDDVPEAAEGELLTRGPYTLRRYYRADDHNARAFTPDGFYRTGDVVRLHPSGNLVVMGRAKDLINRGGERISAEEVENLVLAHPSVFNVAALAMPDRALGERTCVYVSRARAAR